MDANSNNKLPIDDRFPIVLVGLLFLFILGFFTLSACNQIDSVSTKVCNNCKNPY